MKQTKHPLRPAEKLRKSRRRPLATTRFPVNQTKKRKNITQKVRRVCDAFATRFGATRLTIFGGCLERNAHFDPKVGDAFATRLRRVCDAFRNSPVSAGVARVRRRVSRRDPDRSGSLRFFCVKSMGISGNRKSNSHKWQGPGKYDGFIIAVWLMVQAL